MPSVGKFKAVLFDLGGTLVKTLDASEIYARILEVYGVKVSSDDAAKAHRENEREFDFKKRAEFGQDFWVEWNLKILERLDIQKNREFLARKIAELWWEYTGLEAYPEVMETLTQLRIKGIKMGIITNGFESDAEEVLKKLALTSYFDVAVGVDSCRKAKPDKEIFIYAVNKLHVRPEETIFVGDSVKSDYEGAKRAGLKSLLINRERKPSAHVEAITSLTELLHYV